MTAATAADIPGRTEIPGWPVHPAANLFPPMAGDELKALADDIRWNGLNDPVWLYRDPDRGVVLLDGRARVTACQTIGALVDFRFYTGDDPIGFALSQNIELRSGDLTTGQRCAIAVRVHPLYQSEAALHRAHGHPFTARGRRGRTALDRAAASVGTSGRSAAYFKQLAREHPDLSERVASGEIHLHEGLGVAEIRRHAIPAPTGEPVAGKAARPMKKTYYARSDVVKRAAAAEVVHALAGFEIGLRNAKAIDPAITAGEAARWAGDLSTAIRCLRQLQRMLKERTQ